MSGWYIVYIITCCVQGLLIGEYAMTDIGAVPFIIWLLLLPTAYTAGRETGKGR